MPHHYDAYDHDKLLRWRDALLRRSAGCRRFPGNGVVSGQAE